MKPEYAFRITLLALALMFIDFFIYLCCSLPGDSMNITKWPWYCVVMWAAFTVFSLVVIIGNIYNANRDK